MSCQQALCVRGKLCRSRCMAVVIGWCVDPDLEPVGLGADAKVQQVAEMEEAAPEEEEDEDKAFFEV